jgi:hypothetical protein
MSSEAPPNAGRPILVTEQHVGPHEVRFAGTTVCSGFRYSVIRVIGGNMRDPMPVKAAIDRVERSLRDG